MHAVRPAIRCRVLVFAPLDQRDHERQLVCRPGGRGRGRGQPHDGNGFDHRGRGQGATAHAQGDSTGGAIDAMIAADDAAPAQPAQTSGPGARFDAAAAKKLLADRFAAASSSPDLVVHSEPPQQSAWGPKPKVRCQPATTLSRPRARAVKHRRCASVTWSRRRGTVTLYGALQHPLHPSIRASATGSSDVPVCRCQTLVSLSLRSSARQLVTENIASLQSSPAMLPRETVKLVRIAAGVHVAALHLTVLIRCRASHSKTSNTLSCALLRGCLRGCCSRAAHASCALH